MSFLDFSLLLLDLVDFKIEEPLDFNSLNNRDFTSKDIGILLSHCLVLFLFLFCFILFLFITRIFEFKLNGGGGGGGGGIGMLFFVKL